MTELAQTLSTDKVSTEDSTKAFHYMAAVIHSQKNGGAILKADDALTFCNSALGFMQPRVQFFQIQDAAFKRHAAYAYGAKKDWSSASTKMS